LANFFKIREALDRSIEIRVGGSELVERPFRSSSWSMDCGIAFSRRPSSVNRNIAVASPFSFRIISSEFAVNACDGMMAIEIIQQRQIRIRNIRDCDFMQIIARSILQYGMFTLLF
jgi:hypothetical protein